MLLAAKKVGLMEQTKALKLVELSAVLSVVHLVDQMDRKSVKR